MPGEKALRKHDPPANREGKQFGEGLSLAGCGQVLSIFIPSLPAVGGVSRRNEKSIFRLPARVLQAPGLFFQRTEPG